MDKPPIKRERTFFESLTISFTNDNDKKLKKAEERHKKTNEAIDRAIGNINALMERSKSLGDK